MTNITQTNRLVTDERLQSIGTLVSESAHFTGDFTSEKDIGIKIDGKLEGSIILQNGGTIHIGPSAAISGAKLEADHIFIEGRVDGNVIARKTLEISGSATLMGDAEYHELIDLHPRAKIKGRLDFTGEI